MDENGSMEIPVKDKTRIECDLVGANLKNYDYMINLAHFKGRSLPTMEYWHRLTQLH